MTPMFVFQHSLTAVSDKEYYHIEEFFQSTGQLLPYNHESLGNLCLFRIDQNQEGLNYGYLAMDPDLNVVDIQHYTTLHRIRFPKAEYHFSLHRGPLNELKSTFKKIQDEITEEGLMTILDPILVFPRGFPSSISESTTVEIWTATNSDYQAEERRSEQIKEALPRKKFNFYTW